MLYTSQNNYSDLKRNELLVRRSFRLCLNLFKSLFGRHKKFLSFMCILLIFLVVILRVSKPDIQMTENALFETLRFPARKGSLGDHADVDGVIPEPPVNKRPPVQPIVVPKIAKLPIREPTKLTLKTPDYDLESIWALYNQQKEILYFLIGNPRSHLQTDLHIDQKSQAYQDLIDLSLYQLSQIGKLQDSIVDVQTHDYLSAYVQKVINFNQNPKECRNREVNVCELSKGCGFACQMHHLLYCLSVSLGDGRPLLISSSSWHGFDSLYDLIQPLSVSCSLEKAESQNLTKNHIPIIESNAGNIFIPPSVPKHILDSIKKFHSFPLLWWLGQLVTYVYRLKPDVLEQIKVPEFVQPAIGIHVRRTDKIGTEALSYSVEEYMKWVDLYNRRLKIEGKVPIKNIYVATDEIGLIKEFKEKYPDYTFVSNEKATVDANKHRDSRSGTFGILSDIYHLSLTEHLVCTFSSQVCRLAYEWMNGRRVDATQNYHSLDEIYYFGGQRQRDFNLIINHDNTERSFDTKYKFNLRHNDWNGYSAIQDLNTLHTYHVPSFKVKENPIPVDFLAFDNYNAHPDEIKK